MEKINLERAILEELEAAAAEAAAASRVRARQEELDAAKDEHRDAKRMHKDAAARRNAASQKVVASEGVEAIPPRKRGRAGSDAHGLTIQGLPDACKASLEYRRATAKAAMHIFSVGATGEGKFGGVKSQGAWFQGVISAVRNDGVAVTYSIDYEDGDKEKSVEVSLIKHAEGESEEEVEVEEEAPAKQRVRS